MFIQLIECACVFKFKWKLRNSITWMDPDITIVVSKTLKNTISIDHSDDSSLSTDEERSKLTPDATLLQDIFYTALQLRADPKIPQVMILVGVVST